MITALADAAIWVQFVWNSLRLANFPPVVHCSITRTCAHDYIQLFKRLILKKWKIIHKQADNKLHCTRSINARVAITTQTHIHTPGNVCRVDYTNIAASFDLFWLSSYDEYKFYIYIYEYAHFQNVIGWLYERIVPMKRLVYTLYFSDREFLNSSTWRCYYLEYIWIYYYWIID